MSITIKSEKEINLLREGGNILAGILREVSEKAQEGITGLELDRLAESLILKAGGVPAFKGYGEKKEIPFPATLCLSVNGGVVHGIPTAGELKKGDLVKLDLGMKWPASKGLFTDTAVTIGVGKISADATRLMADTQKALSIGIKKIKSGARVGDISSAVQEYLEAKNIGIVRELAGHGVGYKVHEDPLIPNYGRAGEGPLLTEGMVLAIEIMTTLGSGKIKLAKDGWTYISADGALGAHFEHTVVVTKNGADILT